MTTLPLREGIYEDIFWQIGGNANVVEVHNARTLFLGALEIDFFVMIEFTLTMFFYCYDISRENKMIGGKGSEPIEDAIDWTCFGVVTVLGIGNNIHGYFIMKTIEKTFNSKCYFITRILVELVIVYTGLCMILGRNYTWEPLVYYEKTESLYKRVRFYTYALLGISVLVGSLVMYSARKLIKIREKTQGDVGTSGLGGVNYATLGGPF